MIGETERFVDIMGDELCDDGSTRAYFDDEIFEWIGNYQLRQEDVYPSDTYAPFIAEVDGVMQLFIGGKAPGANLGASHGKPDQARYLYGTANFARAIGGDELLTQGRRAMSSGWLPHRTVELGSLRSKVVCEDPEAPQLSLP